MSHKEKLHGALHAGGVVRIWVAAAEPSVEFLSGVVPLVTAAALSTLKLQYINITGNGRLRTKLFRVIFCVEDRGDLF